MNTLKTVDAKINALRAKHGNDGTMCPVCCRHAVSPYRQIVGGRIVEGCVDASHGPHVWAGNGLAWHMRPQAVELRRAELAKLRSL